jgi:hypothetical protein
MDIDYDDLIEDYIQESNEEPPPDEFDYEESLMNEMEMMAASETRPNSAPIRHTPTLASTDNFHEPQSENVGSPQTQNDTLDINNDDDDSVSVREHFAENRQSTDPFAFER